MPTRLDFRFSESSLRPGTPPLRVESQRRFVEEGGKVSRTAQILAPGNLGHRAQAQVAIHPISNMFHETPPVWLTARGNLGREGVRVAQVLTIASTGEQDAPDDAWQREA